MTRFRQCVFRIRCLAIAGVAVTGVAFAQQYDPPQSDAMEAEEELRRYTVEIILFRYGESVSSGTEVFVPDARPAPPGDEAMPGTGPFPESERDRSLEDEDLEGPIAEFGDLLPPADVALSDGELTEIIGMDDIELEVLAPAELTMTDIHEKLIRLDAYRPVLWTGWTQVVREDAETPVIPLRRLGRVPLEFDGHLKLYLSRFLHLVVDVDLEAASATTAGASPAFGDRQFARDVRGEFGRRPFDYRPPPVRYRIAEDRIIKSGDIRYFDHPKFGLLAKLSRVDEAELPETIEDGPPTPAGAQGPSASIR